MSEEINLQDHSTENEENRNEKSIELTEGLIDRIKSHQNIYYALVGGLLAALICAVLWALVTIFSGYQIGFMAIAVGLAVGLSVRFFGAGIDKRFGILGAILALFGCILGNFFSQVGFIAKEYSYHLLEVFSYLDIKTIVDIFIDSFSPIDIVFYGIAITEGYKLSFRKITSDVIATEGYSSNFRYRMPLVIISAVLLCFTYVIIMNGYSGEKSYTYESGAIMAKGNLKNGKYDGPWTFYHENGALMSQGLFYKDVRDGDWSWYNQEGKLEKEGVYKRGVESGVWKTYYESGALYDSVVYIDGRMHGEYLSKYEGGATYQKGDYEMGKMIGTWEAYYESGQLWSEGRMENDEYVGDWFFYFEDGTLSEQHYYEEGKALIKTLLDDNRNLLVKDGNGYYVSRAEDGKTILQEGEYRDGLKAGIWKSYYLDGTINEEGSFEDNIYKIVNHWTPKGEQDVENGNGQYKSYWDNDQLYETGLVKDGLREGFWPSYSQTGGLIREQEYLDGKENGEIKLYNSSGSLSIYGKYENGKRTGEWIWYNEDETLSSSVKFVDDKKDGEQLIYDVSGVLVKKEMYDKGKLVNIQLIY